MGSLKVGGELQVRDALHNHRKTPPNTRKSLISKAVDLDEGGYAEHPKIKIKAGILYLLTEDENGKYYRDSGAEWGNETGWRPEIGGIYVPRDSKKPAVNFLRTSAIETGWDLGKIPSEGITYTTYEEWDNDSFKRELVYGGISQNTVSLLYREFKGAIARPAFSQELKYDLTEGNEIGFRGARFHVIKANNTSIRYKVLRPLD